MAKKTQLKKLALTLIVILAITVGTIFQLKRQLIAIKENLDPQIIIKDYQKIQKKLEKISFFIPKAIKKRFFAENLNNPLINETNYLDFLADAGKILQHLTTGEKNYLVILQNSDELRATGGFMGSYSLINLETGQLKPPEIKDIYDLSGQFSAFKSAPPGLAEYLSAGKGMQIQDSNWNPDLPSSGPTIINFYQEIAQSSPFIEDVPLDGLILINLELAENLLELIGPIALKDYQTTVDATNLAEIARFGRKDFFPGSRDKANFLNALTTQVKIKLSQLDYQQKIALVNLILQELAAKNIQFFSLEPDVEAIWQKYQAAGAINQPSTANFYFSSIESNVGINKANQKIERSLTLITQAELLQAVQISFSNHNQVPELQNSNQFLDTADHLAYINYQRCYFSPQVKIKSVVLIDQASQEQAPLEFTQDFFYNSKGEKFTQVSFLLTLPEQTSQTIKLILENPQQIYPLFIQKQAGVSTLPLKITNLDLQSSQEYLIKSGNFSLDPLE